MKWFAVVIDIIFVKELWINLTLKVISSIMEEPGHNAILKLKLENVVD